MNLIKNEVNVVVIRVWITRSVMFNSYFCKFMWCWYKRQTEKCQCWNFLTQNWKVIIMKNKRAKFFSTNSMQPSKTRTLHYICFVVLFDFPMVLYNEHFDYYLYFDNDLYFDIFVLYVSVLLFYSTFHALTFQIFLLNFPFCNLFTVVVCFWFNIIVLISILFILVLLYWFNMFCIITSNINYFCPVFGQYCIISNMQSISLDGNTPHRNS